MTRHYPDVGSTSDWLSEIFSHSESLPSSGLRHQYGVSALVFQASFRGETTGGSAKCRLFSQVKIKIAQQLSLTISSTHLKV